jgi:microcystin-dependent protein
MSEPFIAEIRMFAGNFAPRGWAFCDGQLLQISDNTALFSLIGSTYGGNGRTTMALPNLQGRAPMHPGHGPGLTARRLGEIVGVETVTLSEAQIPSHTHTERSASGPASSTAPSTATSFATAGRRQVTFAPSSSATVDLASAAVSNTGGGQAHTNIQPYLAMYFIIALNGLYPSRS